MGRTALITGGSMGIGKELARIHAERGGDLVIVARSEGKLNGLAKELESRHSVNVHIITKDLTVEGATREVYNEIKSNNIEINYLINNAGFGGYGKFHEREWENDLAMINLNIVALTALTRFFVPDFVSRGSGKILNISSIASLLPGPLQTIYFATKAYVTSFSNAIAEELRGTGVTVTALLPGPTETGFAHTSGLDKTSLFDKTANARDVALKGYEGMILGKLNVITGVAFVQRMLLNMIPFVPKKMVLKQMSKMQKMSPSL